MKRALGIPILMALTAVWLAAGVINVQKPAGIDPYVRGTSCLIAWEKSGDMPGTVRISLRNANTLAEVMVIKGSAENSGTYSWTVPSNITPGLYMVRVKVVGASIQDDSFAFVIASAWPTLTVTQPNANSDWKTTKTYEITWTNTNPLPDTVNITAKKESGPEFIIKENQPNAGSSGSCSWTVPANLTAGKYCLFVRNTHAFKAVGTCPSFNISIAIIVPNPPMTKKK